ncbi:hypothetical protein C8R47DRAFT_1115480 [Mycena vitilis]|nr:hypothetical protein C8R47DRAFT_1115480 [Mycena vitilis]
MARPTVPELSTTRINRLLRPLRAKCVALAALPWTAYPTSATYGSKGCPEPPPLAILPPPDTVRSFHIEYRSVASLRTALYSVRDCFREIVLKTSGPAQAFDAPQRVPRLVDLCSTIVGENLEGEEDLAGDVEEDSEQLSEVESVYEIIPVHYRRSALLAHALDIVLRCPHHVTLLSILLDVTLQQNLHHESDVLLHCLFQAAASRASPGSSFRLCHPAHSNYLIDLCRKWKEADRPTSVFIRVLTTVLVEAPRPELWCCKALAKLTRELHSQDFASLMCMAGQLVSSVADAQIEEPREHRQFKRRKFGTEELPLASHLDRWLNYSTSFPPFQEATSVLEFLDKCRQSGAHQSTSEPFAATLVCWATHFLSVAAPGSDAPYHLLADVSPTVTMYTFLVEQSFLRQTPVQLQESRVRLHDYACHLRAKNLLLLEASLWACALRFVETSAHLLGPCREVGLYRQELMDLVDDAERRCFGSGLRVSGCNPAPQPLWEWEDGMGCWVQRDSPCAKKAQCQSRVLHRPSAMMARAHPVDGNSPSIFELSFTSLVSSAISNRTSLHAQSQLVRPSLTAPSRTRLPPPLEDVTPSDDALDLFAYSDG